MSKTRWISVPINREEFIKRGNTQEDWEKYQRNIHTHGIAYVRREVDMERF